MACDKAHPFDHANLRLVIAGKQELEAQGNEEQGGVRGAGVGSKGVVSRVL